MDDLGKINTREFPQWIEAYNLAPLDARCKPSSKLIDLVSHCNTIVCSDLRRSIDSAKVLGINDIHCTDAIFREFELPHAKFFSPKLSPDIWSVIYRTLWFMGYAANCESFSLAKQRAASAANILQDKAERHKAILFVGHSLLNSYIAKNLVAQGWQGSISLFNRHWAISEYVKSECTRCNRMC